SSTVTAHYCKFGTGPSNNQSRIVCFSAHCIISGAVTVANQNCKFWNNAVANGIYHFCAILYNPTVLTFATNHKTGNVLQKDQRDFLLVAICNKSRCFISAVAINHAAKLHFARLGFGFCSFYQSTLIGNNSNGPTVNASITSKDCLSIAFFIFFKITIVHEAFYNFAHIVLLSARL